MMIATRHPAESLTGTSKIRRFGPTACLRVESKLSESYWPSARKAFSQATDRRSEDFRVIARGDWKTFRAKSGNLRKLTSADDSFKMRSISDSAPLVQSIYH